MSIKIEFNVRVIDTQTGKVETDNITICPSKVVKEGYQETDDVRKSGVNPEDKELYSTVLGIMTFKEQSKWRNVIVLEDGIKLHDSFTVNGVL